MENQRKKVQSMISTQPMQKNIRLRKQTRDSNYITTEDCHEDYIVLNFETTGMRAGADKIIGIMAIRYEGHQEMKQFETLVNPQRYIPLDVTQRTGISDVEAEAAPVMEDLLESLVLFIDDLPIVLHDSSIEMGFLESLHDFSAVQLPKYTVVDMSKLARKITGQVAEMEQLQRLEQLLLEKEKTYTGVEVCRATAALYEYCCHITSENL